MGKECWDIVWGDASTMSLPGHANIYSPSQRVCSLVDGPNHAANARLIAAAPELLAICKSAKGILNTHYGHHCFTDKQEQSLASVLRSIVGIIAKIETREEA